jgi:type IV pilus assembly protein PilB
MSESLPEKVNSGVDPEVMGDIVQFLVQDGLVTEEQVGHAIKIQDRLDTPRRLLEVLQDLGYVGQDQVKECLLNNRTNIRIGSLLVELGYISEKQLTLALNKQKQDGKKRRLGEVLVGNNYISQYDLTQVLSIHLGFPYVEPDPSSVDPSLLEKAKASLFLEHQFIPLKKEGSQVTVAMVDPMDQKAISAARRLFGTNILTTITMDRFIFETLDVMALGLPDSRHVETSPDHAVSLVDHMIEQAMLKEASDIHIEPMKNKVRVRFRKDGSLVHFKDVPKELEPALINRIKVMSGANITERRRHQDGRMYIEPKLFGRGVDIRVSFYISHFGEKVVMRILTKKTEMLKVSDLGMSPKILERFRDEVLDVPTGVVIITGPTGAGKTTSLYAAINYSNRSDTSIITAEDPVEYVIEGVTQCSINPKLGVTYEDTLRHILRQDPDVIVLGEIRDKFSAESAIQAALTGHKVLTTFHTEDTIGGLLRLMNMDIETFLISSTVVSVVAQRLIKRVCPNCREVYVPSPRDIRRIHYSSQDIGDYEFQLGNGCESCDYTGYKGRVGVFELLVLNEYVKEAILARKTSSEIRRICMETTGLVTLLEDGLAKAARGVTSIQEIMRTLPVLEAPRPLEQIFRLTGEYSG